MANLDLIPGVTKELVEALEKRYPPRCIRLCDGIADAHRYAGMVDLVAALRGQLDDYGDSSAVTIEDLIVGEHN